MSLLPGVSAIAAGINAGTNLFGTITNYDQQKANLAWQKEVQNKTWEREDNAVQRRAADLEAAGMSPLLAAGSAANAGQVVSTQAPQMGQLTIGTDMLNAITQGVGAIKTLTDIQNQNKQMDLKQLETDRHIQGTWIDNLTKRLAMIENYGIDATPITDGKGNVLGYDSSPVAHRGQGIKQLQRQRDSYNLDTSKQYDIRTTDPLTAQSNILLNQAMAKNMPHQSRYLDALEANTRKATSLMLFNTISQAFSHITSGLNYMGLGKAAANTTINKTFNYGRR